MAALPERNSKISLKVSQGWQLLSNLALKVNLEPMIIKYIIQSGPLTIEIIN